MEIFILILLFSTLLKIFFRGFRRGIQEDQAIVELKRTVEKSGGYDFKFFETTDTDLFDIRQIKLSYRDSSSNRQVRHVIIHHKPQGEGYELIWATPVIPEPEPHPIIPPPSKEEIIDQMQSKIHALEDELRLIKKLDVSHQDLEA